MNPYDESLTPEEFDRRLELMRNDENEQAERLALISWFMERYPTARERLAYARRKAHEWQRRPIIIPDMEKDGADADSSKP
ncbi:MAG: hypothetical protein FWD73_12770 [Polyangiaceae bacterium]|nr:hypothetical protein [Polyangiaceae bacterium]